MIKEGWQIINTADESIWTKQYLKGVFSLPSLPDKKSKLGPVTIEWEELDPGVVVLRATGGTTEDKQLAREATLLDLLPHGYEKALLYIEPQDEFGRRTADWAEVQEKAKRLIDESKVTLLRNGWNNIVAMVQGDTEGKHMVEVSRDDPDSRALTQWDCDCSWSDYSWQRTRKWKKYEGRPCSHTLAVWWLAQATPLDEAPPEGQELPPGQRGYQPQVPADIPATDIQEPELPEMPEPVEAPPVAPVAQPSPPPKPEIIPPWPGQQLELIPPGQLQPGQDGITVSEPGARQPNPFNPIQGPSTYSSVREGAIWPAEDWEPGKQTDRDEWRFASDEEHDDWAFEWPDEPPMDVENLNEEEAEGWYKWAYDPDQHRAIVTPAYINGRKRYHDDITTGFGDEMGVIDLGVIDPSGMVSIYNGRITPELLDALQQELPEVSIRAPRKDEAGLAVENVWRLAKDNEVWKFGAEQGAYSIQLPRVDNQRNEIVPWDRIPEFRQELSRNFPGARISPIPIKAIWKEEPAENMDFLEIDAPSTEDNDRAIEALASLVGDLASQWAVYAVNPDGKELMVEHPRSKQLQENPEPAAESILEKPLPYADTEGNPLPYSMASEKVEFHNGDMVRLKEEEMGVLEGKSESHGAGQYKTIPKGSIGEVITQDSSTGWVDVIFAGPQKDAGPLEPYHIQAYLDPEQLDPMPNVAKPGPFIRRRR